MTRQGSQQTITGKAKYTKHYMSAATAHTATHVCLLHQQALGGCSLLYTSAADATPYAAMSY